VPKVSVVVPTWNRADLLAQTIDKIEHQTMARNSYDVIVIDNESTDHTQKVLGQKSRVYPNLKTFSQSKPGAAATRNVGIQAATGDIVLFIDDDIQAEPNLVEAHWQYHQRHPGSSIIGGVITPWDGCTDAFLRYLRDREIFNPYSIARGPMDFSYYHTGNVSTARSVLLAVGGFNEQFAIYGMEDIELGYRLERQGSRMVHGPDAKAVHQYFPTYRQFVQRCEQAGYSLGRMIELHPELRSRFVENGKRTRLLKRIHGLYRVFSTAARPLTGALARWEERRGCGQVSPLLDRHYYWALRYHFFLGYKQYTRDFRDGTNGNGANGSVLHFEKKQVSGLAITDPKTFRQAR
jgi:glycosyltransferase involved in cell wall biosynthesis